MLQTEVPMSWFMHVSAVVGFAAFGGITAWLWTEARGQRQYVRVDATVLHSGVVETATAPALGHS